MKKYLVLSLAVLFLFSCEQFTGSGNDKKGTKKNTVKKENKNEPKVEQANVNVKIKYPFKSGVIKYANDVMGTKSTLKVYFDDYGAKECAVSETEVEGNKITGRSLRVGNYLYQLSMEQGIGSKVEIDDSFQTYLFDTKEFEKRLKEVNGKKLGTAEVLGRKCQVYSMEENNALTKMWVWKNVILKMKAEMDGMETGMEAVEIKETSNLPKGIFEVPKGFNIEEIKAEDYNEDIDDFDDENAAG